MDLSQKSMDGKAGTASGKYFENLFPRVYLLKTLLWVLILNVIEMKFREKYDWNNFSDSEKGA